jgi:two-component system, OmpR family, phosphate regulon response regulator PhoB
VAALHHHQYRVLIVDDDPGCRTLVSAVFASRGFEVAATDSVLGATELIGQFMPHAIVLDLGLPYRSGASWLLELRADPATVNLPVIILSAIADVVPPERLRLAQAVVTKPFRSQVLVDAVLAACTGPGIPADAATDATCDSGSIRRLGSL